MDIAILNDLAGGALGALGTLLLHKAYKWFRSGDAAKAKAEAIGRAAEKRDEKIKAQADAIDRASSRRIEKLRDMADNRYVLKEVCQKCEQVRDAANETLGQGIEHLREYVGGIDKKTDAIGADVRQIRDHLMKG